MHASPASDMPSTSAVFPSMDGSQMGSAGVNSPRHLHPSVPLHVDESAKAAQSTPSAASRTELSKPQILSHESTPYSRRAVAPYSAPHQLT